MKDILNIILLLAICIISSVHSQACPSGWVAYKDEKCFFLVKNFTTWPEAEDKCKELDPSDTSQLPSLATIKSRPEQEFLTNLIFVEMGAESNVWIGLRREIGTGQFYWNDKSLVRFSNWGVGYPTQDAERDCGELESRLSSSLVDDGQWRDVSCLRGNWFVCEKLQMWSQSKLQRKWLDANVNPVPIGFLYTQLPGQPSPYELWPTVEWSDVSGEYAGQFFRAEGGDSAPWGEVQSHNSPRIVKLTYSESRLDHIDYVSEMPVVEGTSPLLKIGNQDQASGTLDTREYLTVEASGGEVRPVNRAVRIWRRYN